jgi:hypothetical protein
MRRFRLKQLYKDLKKVNARLKSPRRRTNKFGNKLDEFIYTGPFTKQANKRDSGFFTEFQLLTGGIYNLGSQPDLHLSIIDANGYAVAHVTFKPDGPWGVAFHYGIKHQDDAFPIFWVTRPQKNKGKYDEKMVEVQMEQTYNFVIKYIWVVRRDDSGKELERYPFHPLGTIGRVENTPKKRAAEEVARKRSYTPGGVSEISAKRRALFSDITNKINNSSNITVRN